MIRHNPQKRNRAKIFINGTQLTSFISNNYPSQNYDLSGLGFSKNFHIGARAYGGAASYLDGYITEFNFIDGTSYAPTYFAETNDNGVWVPKNQLEYLITTMVSF